MGFIPGETPREVQEEIKKEQQLDTADVLGAEELDKKATTVGADTEIMPKKEREYDRLGNQLDEFKTLKKSEKERVLELAQEMAGKKVKDIEEAKEIYKKKLGLYKTATGLLKGNKRTGQIKDIIKQIKEEGRFEFGGKEFDTDETRKLKKDGKKINGRVKTENIILKLPE
jgi:beta-glucosidase-like glycosyl hydrolase